MIYSWISHFNILHMPTSLPAAQPPKGFVRLPGSERHPSGKAVFLGPAESSEIIQITIVLRRRTDGPAMPDFDYYRNTPPNKREKLAPEEFGGKYGAHPGEMEQVVAFAETSKLTVVGADAGARTVLLSGSVAQFSGTFAVPLGRFEVTPDRNRKQGGL